MQYTLYRDLLRYPYSYNINLYNLWYSFRAWAIRSSVIPSLNLGSGSAPGSGSTPGSGSAPSSSWIVVWRWSNPKILIPSVKSPYPLYLPLLIRLRWGSTNDVLCHSHLFTEQLISQQLRESAEISFVRYTSLNGIVLYNLYCRLRDVGQLVSQIAAFS